MKTKLFFIFLLNVGVIFYGYAQNVGIDETGSAPNPSAMLDIKSSSKGLLIPRVSLTATNNSSPISSPATSLLVYNTNTAGSGATAVTTGFYYWDAAQWVSSSLLQHNR